MDPADKVERWPIDRLTPYARNARTHSDAQVAQLAASIKEWGWTTPVLVDPDGSIIAGHGRVMAARKLGIKTVPVVVAEGWSEAKRRAYVIADNKLAMNAGWDDEVLKLELGELQALDFDLDLTGFSADELGDLFDDDDKKEEAPQEDIFEQSVQLDPAKEFIVVICEPGEYEDAKNLLGLRQVRRGGYEAGSAFDAVSFERAITYQRLADAVRNTK